MKWPQPFSGKATLYTCIAIAEFRILPKSYDLHGSLAMCGVSCQYNSSEMATIYFFEAAFVINLQEQLPTDSIIPTPCHQKGGSPSPEIIAPIVVILFIIIMALVVVLLVVSFLYMRSRKKSVPYVEAKAVDHDQLALLQVMEVVILKVTMKGSLESGKKQQEKT